MTASVQCATAEFRAVEYHHFNARGRWLLFDVMALRVIESCEADGVILETAARASLTRAGLVDRVVAGGCDREHATARIDALIDAHFLLPPGEDVVLAKLAQP